MCISKEKSLEEVEALLKEAFRNASESQRIKLSYELALIVGECLGDNEKGRP